MKIDLKKIILITVLCVLLFSLLCFVCHANSVESDVVTEDKLAEGESEIVVYIKEKIVPIVISVAGSGITIYGVIAVLLSKIRFASDKFKVATEFIKQASDDREKIEKLTEAILEYSKDMARLKSENDKLRSELKKVIEMIEIGFCSNKELVADGKAKLIAALARGEDEAL